MMSTDKSFDYFHATLLPNLEILSVFDRHIGKNRLMSQIRETVNERSHLLDQEYKNQQHYLKEKRQEYIDQALIYEKNKDNEQIGQLIIQCNALKFELTALEFSMSPHPYLTLITQDNLKHEQLQSIPIESHENDTVIRLHTAESSPSIIIPKNTKIKSQRSLVTKSLNKKNQSTTYPDDSVEECPICSMVFSPYMDPPDRNIHVEEHFSANIENHSAAV